MTTLTRTPTLLSSLPGLVKPAQAAKPRLALAAANAPAQAAQVIALHRPFWSRAARTLLEAWSSWRAAARERANWRALAHLDSRTLKDVGLGEFAAPQSRPSWIDLERGRW